MTEATIDKLLISGLAPARALAPESDKRNKPALVEQTLNQKNRKNAALLRGLR